MGIFSFFTKNTNDSSEEDINSSTFDLDIDDTFFLKLKSKSTKDKLQNIVLYSSCSASKEMRKDKANYLNKLNALLAIKHQSADNIENDYIDILIKNIIYINNISTNIRNNITYYLSKGKVLSVVQYNLLLTKLEQAYNISSYEYNKEDNNIKDTYLKQKSNELLITELESDYMYSLTYLEILNGTFINILKQENIKELLLERNSKDIVSLIDYYIRMNSSEALSNKK